jgi:hypothetical protein
VRLFGSLGRPLLVLEFGLEGRHLLGLGGKGREHLGELGGSRRCKVVDGWLHWGGRHIDWNVQRRPGGVLSFERLRRPGGVLRFLIR